MQTFVSDRLAVFETPSEAQSPLARFSRKDIDAETGFYCHGARYLNPKTSVWISADPAMGDYIPQAPVNDEAKKHNENLPGMGGVFNYVNFHVYRYAGSNPVRYVYPDGEWFLIDDFVFAAIAKLMGYRDDVNVFELAWESFLDSYEHPLDHFTTLYDFYWQVKDDVTKELEDGKFDLGKGEFIDGNGLNIEIDDNDALIIGPSPNPEINPETNPHETFPESRDKGSVRWGLGVKKEL